MKFDRYDYTVCTALLPYIVNGDASGIEDDEVRAVDEWLAQHPSAHVSVETDGLEFAWCEILKTHGDCSQVAVMVPKES